MARVPGRGSSSGVASSCARRSGEAFTRYQAGPVAADRQRVLGPVHAGVLAASQPGHPQFHCGMPPPAAVPRNRTITGVGGRSAPFSQWPSPGPDEVVVWRQPAHRVGRGGVADERVRLAPAAAEVHRAQLAPRGTAPASRPCPGTPRTPPTRTRYRPVLPRVRSGSRGRAGCARPGMAARRRSARSPVGARPIPACTASAGRRGGRPARTPTRPPPARAPALPPRRPAPPGPPPASAPPGCADPSRSTGCGPARSARAPSPIASSAIASIRSTLPACRTTFTVSGQPAVPDQAGHLPLAVVGPDTRHGVPVGPVDVLNGQLYVVQPGLDHGPRRSA